MLGVFSDRIGNGLGLAPLGREPPDLAYKVEYDRLSIWRKIECQLYAFVGTAGNGGVFRVIPV
jgi:hypothetical protein